MTEQMNNLELSYVIREITGKKSVNKKMQQNGLIPAVIYGAKQETKHLWINIKEFLQKKPELVGQIITLKSDSSESTLKAFVKSIDYHPVTDIPIHIDFLGITDNEDNEISIEVPLKFFNVDKCVGIKMGGHLNRVKRKLRIKAKPVNVPKNIMIDTKNMDIGDSFRVSDLPTISNIKILDRDDIIIVTIVGRRKRKDPTEKDNVEENVG